MAPIDNIHCLRQRDDPAHVDVHDLEELRPLDGRRGVVRMAGGGDAGVVDEDVDAVVGLFFNFLFFYSSFSYPTPRSRLATGHIRNFFSIYVTSLSFLKN